MGPHAAESPAKKQSKWSPDEDALIIELRGSGMKWEDISKRLPGRSAISCRLHYQNYLERRSEWDEERKNKLARLYERFKPEMWAKVAEEMQVPWRAAEAMHWQMGEQDMARRAGVIPFSLTSVNPNEPPGPPHRGASTRGHAHSHSQGSLPRDMGPGRYSRGPPPMQTMPPTRPIAARRETMPPRPPSMPPDLGPRLPLLDVGQGPPAPPPHGHLGHHIYQGPPPHQVHHGGHSSHSPRLGHAPLLAPPGHPPPGPPPLAPIQAPSDLGRGGGMLPGISELTTGVSPYSTPAYSVGVPSVSPVPSATASPGSIHSGMPPYHPQLELPSTSKRPGSPALGPRETIRRRHLDPRQEEMERRRMT